MDPYNADTKGTKITLNHKGLVLGVCVVVGQEAEALRAPPNIARQGGVRAQEKGKP